VHADEEQKVQKISSERKDDTVFIAIAMMYVKKLVAWKYEASGGGNGGRRRGIVLGDRWGGG